MEVSEGHISGAEPARNTWFVPLISCCYRAVKRPLGMGVCAGGQRREQGCMRQCVELEGVLIHLQTQD